MKEEGGSVKEKMQFVVTKSRLQNRCPKRNFSKCRTESDLFEFRMRLNLRSVLSIHCPCADPGVRMRSIVYSLSANASLQLIPRVCRSWIEVCAKKFRFALGSRVSLCSDGIVYTVEYCHEPVVTTSYYLVAIAHGFRRSQIAQSTKKCDCSSSKKYPCNSSPSRAPCPHEQQAHLRQRSRDSFSRRYRPNTSARHLYSSS